MPSMEDIRRFRNTWAKPCSRCQHRELQPLLASRNADVLPGLIPREVEVFQFISFDSGPCGRVLETAGRRPA